MWAETPLTSLWLAYRMVSSAALVLAPLLELRVKKCILTHGIQGLQRNDSRTRENEDSKSKKLRTRD